MIYVDSRRGSGELTQLIENGVECVLDYADFMFFGNGPEGEVQIGIERKRISDLIASVSTGRLSGHQLPGLLQAYFRVYLVIEGQWRQSPMTGGLEVMSHGHWCQANHGRREFTYRDLWQYLSTLENLTGVIVRQTQGPVETALQIEALHRWWDKPWEKHRAHEGIHRTQSKFMVTGLKKPSLLRRMAQELPGVGADRAKAVEAHFKTVRGMYEAEEKEWMSVEGVGKLTARKAYEALHG